MASNSYSNDSDKHNKTKNITKIALLAGILAFGVLAAALGTVNQVLNAAAQTNNNSNSSTATKGEEWQQKLPLSTVSTSGTAAMKVTPDKFSVTVGVETNGTTAQEAASKNADLMSGVIAALKNLGVKENQIGTSNYNIYPIYQSREPTKACPQIYPLPPECQPGQVITGYRASNSATVTLNVNGTIDAGKVIDAAVKAGANNINGVYFFISQEMQQQVRDSLIKDAIGNAKHRAEIAADAANITVIGVQSISLNDVYFPIFYKNLDQAAPAGSGAPTPILPTEQEVTTTVNMVFYLKNNMTSEDSSSVVGMLRTKDNTNCTNPPNGPMIC
jgi:uncharacterized protein YggE